MTAFASPVSGAGPGADRPASDAASVSLERSSRVADSTARGLYRVSTALPRRGKVHIAFQRSADGGATWSRPVRVSRRADDGRVHDPRFTVGPRGDVHIAWTVMGADSHAVIRLRTSADLGGSWSGEATVPAPGLLAGHESPAIAVDHTSGRHRGRIHLAWTGSVAGEGDARGLRHVFASHSDDGSTWSAPIRVDDVAAGREARLASLAVAHDGMPYVAWSAGDGAASAPRLSRSEDGGDTWPTSRALPDGGGGPTVRIDTGFDLTACQGDLAAGPGSSVHPSWTVANRNPLFANEYTWALASARDWPLVPAGSSSAGAGGTGAILPAVAIPDSAAIGVNRICLTVTDPGGLNVRQCCFDVTVERAPADVPVFASAFDLRAGSPDPATRRTRIDYSLPHAGPATLGIYDLRGERVRTLASGDRPAGPFSITWDGRDDRGGRAGAGAYLCRLEAFGTMRVQRLIWVR